MWRHRVVGGRVGLRVRLSVSHLRRGLSLARRLLTRSRVRFDGLPHVWLHDKMHVRMHHVIPGLHLLLLVGQHLLSQHLVPEPGVALRPGVCVVQDGGRHGTAHVRRHSHVGGLSRTVPQSRCLSLTWSYRRRSSDRSNRWGWVGILGLRVGGSGG